MKEISHYIRISFFIAVCFLVVACSGNESRSVGNKSSNGIEFLGRSDCPHSPTMEQSLISALEKQGLGNKYQYIELASLPVDDHRRGYGTPTVLINGEDLFGMPRPKPTNAAPR